ncbi:class I SAM-dependent methyltransferase [candidate division KSB1 bacterium]|nr:class I SAM-dependent methyltransferase [candidate division KSB1 bacterium]
MNQEVFDLFAETHDWVYTFKGDIPFWVHQAKQSKGRILELGCGTGRITWEIANAGIPIIGIDISEKMLEKANSKRSSYKNAATVLFKQADMQHFNLGIKFPLIIMPGRSFEFLSTRREQSDTLHCCINHLEDQGRIIIFVISPLKQRIREEVEEFRKSVVNPQTGNVCHYYCREYYDRRRQKITSFHRLEEISPDGHIFREWIYGPIHHRLSEAKDMEKLGQDLNLEVVARYSDWLRKPYKEGDTCLIYVYQK